MGRNLNLLSGAGLGAAIAMLFDPAAGGRRRARVKDKVMYAARKTRDAAGATGRDVSHRTRGLVATLGRRRKDEEVSDEVLVERVRAKLGRYVSHARAIDVIAQQGMVTLRGPILARQHARLMKVIPSVRGVRELKDELERHESAEGVPSLQGGEAAPSEYGALRLTPTNRLISGMSGATLFTWGAARRDAIGVAMMTTGAILALAGTGLLGRRGFAFRRRSHDDSRFAPPWEDFHEAPAPNPRVM